LRVGLGWANIGPTLVGKCDTGSEFGPTPSGVRIQPVFWLVGPPPGFTAKACFLAGLSAKNDFSRYGSQTNSNSSQVGMREKDVLYEIELSTFRSTRKYWQGNTLCPWGYHERINKRQ
jgi:hypothetical protein